MYVTHQSDVARLLVAEGTKLSQSPRQFIEFSKIKEADELLNDIEHVPHAFVLGCVVDRQIKSERAWLIPLKVAELAGGREFAKQSQLTKEQLTSLLQGPRALHRLPVIMADLLQKALLRIEDRYDADASRIWADKPSSAELVYRFLEFDGIGPKIATMAANILARQFHVPLADYYSIDISADVHVRRVFARLGLTPSDASTEQVIYRARSIHPEFPGLLDRPAFEIGRRWCRPTSPQCGECSMRTVCPSALLRG